MMLDSYLTPFLTKNDNGTMSCPACNDEASTHIDWVVVTHAGGRVSVIRCFGEDGGAGTEYSEGPISRDSNRYWWQRRHAITLGGFCEMCGAGFAITFLQHKGDTQLMVDVLPHPERDYDERHFIERERPDWWFALGPDRS